MKVSSQRQVKHHITIDLTDSEHSFTATHKGNYHHDQNAGKEFVVDHVQWPRRHGWNVDQSVMDDDTLVTLSGYVFRKDGTVGVRRGAVTVPLSDLPVAVRNEMVRAHGEVYAP